MRHVLVQLELQHETRINLVCHWIYTYYTHCERTFFHTSVREWTFSGTSVLPLQIDIFDLIPLGTLTRAARGNTTHVADLRLLPVTLAVKPSRSVWFCRNTIQDAIKRAVSTIKGMVLDVKQSNGGGDCQDPSGHNQIYHLRTRSR